MIDTGVASLLSFYLYAEKTLIVGFIEGMYEKRRAVGCFSGWRRGAATR